MDSNGQKGETQAATPAAIPITSREALTRDTIRIPREAAYQLGPASQTLAAITLLAIGRDKCEMFCAVELIADLAQIPVSTVRKHLRVLAAKGWILDKGREALGPNTRRTRRTCTYALTQRTTGSLEPYMELPRWAAKNCKTWAERIVTAYLISQHKAAFHAAGDDERECHVDELGDERDKRTAQHIVDGTGLASRTVWAALRKLTRVGIVETEVGEWGRDAIHSWFRLNPDVTVPSSWMPAKSNRRARPGPKASEKRTGCLDLGDEITVTPICRDVGATGAQRKKWTVPVAKVGSISSKSGHRAVAKVDSTCSKSGHSLYVEPVIQNLPKKNPSKEPNGQNVAAVADSGNDADLFFVDPELDGGFAQELFRRLGHHGDDAAIVWQAACLSRIGAISQGACIDATQAVRECEPGDKLGYFYVTLCENVGEGADRFAKRESGERKLKVLLRRTRNPAKLKSPLSVPAPRIERPREDPPTALGTVMAKIAPTLAQPKAERVLPTPEEIKAKQRAFRQQAEELAGAKT